METNVLSLTVRMLSPDDAAVPDRVTPDVFATTSDTLDTAPGGAADDSSSEPSVQLGELYVATVHAADGVRFAAVAESRAVLVRQLSTYVRQHAADVLWPNHARHVETLLARGELESAVEVYFGLVGRRWDKEWLVTTVVAPTDDHPGVLDAATGLGTVAIPEELAEQL